MELKLKKAGHDFYEPAAFEPFSCETMRESIVPDSRPDIARIVDTTALVYLTGRESAADGRLSASGTVDVSVLYIPEKGEAPCALRFQMPFQCYSEGAGAADCEFLDIRGELRSIDTRVLNPRKVLTRADLILYPAGCRHAALELCTGTEGDDAVQLLQERRETRVVDGVREREFTFVEELPLSAGRPEAEEILFTRVDLRPTDSKLIGNKLVVKGLMAATVLYRESGGRLNLLQQELPFSQILEGSGFREDWESEADCRLLSAECRLGSEGAPNDGHVMTLTLLLRARATVWRREEVCFIADLYSTAAPVTCETREMELTEDSQRHTRRVNARHLLETGAAVRSVVDTELGFGPLRREEEQLTVPVWARCLYLDENDALRGVRGAFTVSCPADLPEGCRMEGTAACGGDVMTNILPDGIELRFPMECTLNASRRVRHLCVSGGETDEEAREVHAIPSLILRKMGREETLWSVAKQYRTTGAAILEVNEIGDEGQLPRDRLLLIPKAK